MLPMLAALLLSQSAASVPATPAVSEARAKSLVGLGFAIASLAYSSRVAAFLCAPSAAQSNACQLAAKDAQADRAKVQAATRPDVKPENLNGCERVLLGAVTHYAEDRLLADGVATAQGRDPALASALANDRSQLQHEDGPDPKVVAACRAVPGSWFAATWDGVVKVD